MATTQLFVELLIIGFGGIIWLSLLIVGVFKGTINDFSFLSSPIYVFPIGGFAYVLGIVTDRIAYGIFRPLEKRNEKGIFKNNNGLTAEEHVYQLNTYSEELKSKISYNRSRLRVVRSWTLNFVLIALALVFLRFRLPKFPFEIFYYLLTLLVILILVTYIVWNELSKDYFNCLKSSFKFLSQKADREE